MAVSKVPRPITVKWLGKTCEIIYKPAKVFTDEKLINSGLCLIARTLDTAGVENLSSCGPFMLVKKGMRAQEKDRGVEIRPGTNNCYEFWVFPENASPNQRLVFLGNVPENINFSDLCNAANDVRVIAFPKVFQGFGRNEREMEERAPVTPQYASATSKDLLDLGLHLVIQETLGDEETGSGLVPVSTTSNTEDFILAYLSDQAHKKQVYYTLESILTKEVANLCEIQENEVLTMLNSMIDDGKVICESYCNKKFLYEPSKKVLRVSPRDHKLIQLAIPVRSQDNTFGPEGIVSDAFIKKMYDNCTMVLSHTGVITKVLSRGRNRFCFAVDKYVMFEYTDKALSNGIPFQIPTAEILPKYFASSTQEEVEETFTPIQEVWEPLDLIATLEPQTLTVIDPLAEAARALAKQFLERSGPYLDLVSRKETVEKEALATLINVSAVSQDIARLFAELTEYQVLLEKEEARHTQYRAEIAAIEERISNPDTLEMIEGAQYYSFFKVQTEMANKIENASS